MSGRQLCTAAACTLWVLGPPVHARSLERTGYVMGTLLTIEVEAETSAQARQAMDTAFEIAQRLDRLLSNYRPESEISAISARAPQAVAVSAETFDFLARTLDWSERSRGALDPTVGPLVKAWGFDTDHPGLPDPALLDSLRSVCGHRLVRMDSSTRSVSVPAGASIDPGATGKGFALAIMDLALTRAGIRTWRADFGGQLFVRGVDSLLVPVRHPRSDTQAVAWLLLSAGSVATSGDYDRFFEVGGVRYTHIFDPRTGRPVMERAAVTVCAPDPFAADALSTALFVLGPDAAEPLLKQAGAGALFAEWNGDSLAIVIVGEWPEAP